jgi:hypothetical protein
MVNIERAEEVLKELRRMEDVPLNGHKRREMGKIIRAMSMVAGELEHDI